MPRLPGGPARDLPACPGPGHENRKVVKDGKYANPPRQRFRCSDGADFHRGPVTGRRYDFPVREGAAAFAAVGGGASYQRAALRARAASGLELLEGFWGGNAVAEWLDALAPVVLADQVETRWPETLVLDTPPRLVITDNAVEAGHAVRQVWSVTSGPSFPVPFAKRCEHHLYANARSPSLKTEWTTGARCGWSATCCRTTTRPPRWTRTWARSGITSTPGRSCCATSAAPP